jgi:anthranilate phosphoribosyltransferase
MSISSYIKEVGRGKDGARAMNREQAAHCMGQVLDGKTTDLEVGAFCIAMRVKGETANELLGFLDAIHTRMPQLPDLQGHWVILPSYNGARKLPVLTPLLAGLLAERGINVLVHGMPEDPARVTTAQVWQALGWATLAEVTPESIATNPINSLGTGLFFASTQTLMPDLARLLNVRRTIGVRNSAHSLVKLMNPLVNSAAQALVIGSYTHPEYLHSMGEVFARVPYPAMLLRGTEGEPVADPRRCPQMDVFDGQGGTKLVQAAQAGPLQTLPDLPEPTVAATATYTQRVLAGELPVPAPMATQVEHILLMCSE